MDSKDALTPLEIKLQKNQHKIDVINSFIRLCEENRCEFLNEMHELEPIINEIDLMYNKKNLDKAYTNLQFASLRKLKNVLNKLNIYICALKLLEGNLRPTIKIENLDERTNKKKPVVKIKDASVRSVASYWINNPMYPLSTDLGNVLISATKIRDYFEHGKSNSTYWWQTFGNSLATIFIFHGRGKNSYATGLAVLRSHSAYKNTHKLDKIIKEFKYRDQTLKFGMDWVIVMPSLDEFKNILIYLKTIEEELLLLSKEYIKILSIRHD